MSGIISSVIKLFFIDLAILAGVFFLIYLVFLLVKAIQNGKKHSLTEENIALYCLKLFPSFIGKHLKNILSWAIVFFIIHIFVQLFETFANYIKEIGTYDNCPILAFFIDAISAIIPVITPIILPFLVILLVILLGYGFFATLSQVYKDEIENDKILNVIKSVDKNPNEKKDENDSKENEANNSESSTPYNLDLDSYLNSDIDAELNEDFIKEPPEKKEKNEVSVPKKTVYKPTTKQLVFYFFENIQKAFFKISKFLPKVLIAVAICIGLNSIFVSIRNITTIVENQKRIQELNMTIKNLSKSEGLARIILLKEERTSDTIYPLKTYRIEILDINGDPIPEQTQEVTLRGKEIYIDAININFEYSQIAQGAKYNIAYPYRIYSETMSPDKGVPLTCMYQDGKSYPVIYSLDSSEIYGMEENVYFQRLSEIFDTIKDEKLSREMGIRSVLGVANHFTMKKNEIRDIFIEGTGGISVKKHSTLFEEGESIELSLESYY